MFGNIMLASVVRHPNVSNSNDVVNCSHFVFDRKMLTTLFK